MTHTCVLVDSGGDGYGGYELVLVPVVLAMADLEPWPLLLVGGGVPGHGTPSAPAANAHNYDECQPHFGWGKPTYLGDAPRSCPMIQTDQLDSLDDTT